MLTIAALFDTVAALGLAGLAAKYLFGAAPTEYHGRMLLGAGAEDPGRYRRILRAIYVPLGALALGLAILVLAVAWFGVAQGHDWAIWSVLVAGLAAGVPAALATRRAERVTGVRTPWRTTAALVVVVVLGFAAAIA